MRQICSIKNPYEKNKGKFWQHPEAIFIDEIDYGYGFYVYVYKCPICNLKFEEEQPQ